MFRTLLTITLMVIFLQHSAQLTPPYLDSFESNNNDWHSESQPSQIDPWQRGSTNTPYGEAFSGFFSISTNPNGLLPEGNMFLYSPQFDLSNVTVDYILSFNHKYDFASGNSFYAGLEYTINNGNSWNLLLHQDSQNWQNTSGWEGVLNNFKLAKISLAALTGESNVSFRFIIYNYSPNDHYGWAIDNFKIYAASNPDIIGEVGQTLKDIPYTATNWSVQLNYNCLSDFYTQQTNVHAYHSSDTILSIDDTLIYNGPVSFTPGNSATNISFTNNGFILPGANYILYIIDSTNTLIEQNELNNFAYTKIETLAVFDLPYHQTFDSIDNNLQLYDYANGIGITPKVFYLNEYTTQRTSGSLSFPYSWSSNSYEQLELPYIKLYDTSVIHYFYKMKSSGEISIKKTPPPSGGQWYDITNSQVTHDYEKGWKYTHVEIDPSMGNPFKFRISSNNSTAIENLYIGSKKSDLYFDETELIRHSFLGEVSDTITLKLANCGFETANNFNIDYYWSTDSISDSSDISLGQINSLNIANDSSLDFKFDYVKINNTLSQYFIICVIDSDSTVDEMREYNNIGIFKVMNIDRYSLPYIQDFESGSDNWYHLSDYKHNPIFIGQAKGNYQGITGNAIGMDSDSISTINTRASIYSPILDMRNLSHPVLEMDLEKTTHLSIFNSEYSIDGGSTWQSLKPTNSSFKRWESAFGYSQNGGTDNIAFQYNSSGSLYKDTEKTFPQNFSYMGRNDDSSRNCILDLSFLTNEQKVQFRFNFGNGYENGKVYLDNFKITEGKIDLTNDYSQKLYLHPNSDTLALGFHLRNNENYSSNETSVNIYLSSDSIVDNSDVLLYNNYPIDSIPPDQRQWNSCILTLPSLVGKNYILIEIDPNNLVVETNENNNLGIIELVKSGIQNTHCETFSNYSVNGWKIYGEGGLLAPSGAIHIPNHRFVHRVYSDKYGGNLKLDKQMNLDRMWVTPNTSVVPIMYLETPTYNLANNDSCFISFDFSLVSSLSNVDSDGGNLQYTLNGGETWTYLGLLNDSLGENWYTKDMIEMLGYEPGWRGCSDQFVHATYNCSNIIGTDSLIAFRFKYKSNFSCSTPGNQGLKVDNFYCGDSQPKVDLIAMNQNDSIQITQSGIFPFEDVNVCAQLFNNGDVPISNHAKLYWSEDSILSTDDLEAGVATFTGVDTNVLYNFCSTVNYPYSFCDSSIYLIYELNPELNTTTQNHSLIEDNYNNNYGFFNVQLIDHFNTYPPNRLSINQDTTLCEGDILSLSHTLNANGFGNTFTWSNGESFYTNNTENNTINITQSGLYYFESVSNFGCTSFSDTIEVNFIPNNDSILADKTFFCIDDSVNLYIPTQSSVNWLHTASSDTSIYVYGAGVYSATVTNGFGCMVNSEIELTMEYEIQPSLNYSDSVYLCQSSVMLETFSAYDNYLWSTFDTTKSIIINQTGDYYCKYENSCGLISTDTIHVVLDSLIYTTTPSSHFSYCQSDTLELSVQTDPNYTTNWYGLTSYNSTIFEDLFNYYGSTVSTLNNTSWQIISEDSLLDQNVDFSVASGSIMFYPKGDSISLITEYFNINDFYDIELFATVVNKTLDPIRLYYQVDGENWQVFESNGVVQPSGSFIDCEQYIYQASNIRIMITFDGYSNSQLEWQKITELNIKGKSIASSYLFSSDSTLLYPYPGSNDNFLLELSNGFCTKKVPMFGTGISVANYYSGKTVCMNTEHQICPVIPITTQGFNVDWTPSSAITQNLGECITVQAAEDEQITVMVTDSNGCSRVSTLFLNVYDFIGDITIQNNQIISSYSGNHTWIDCDSGNIMGSTTSNFTPTYSGNYAAVINYNGCTDTSACIQYTLSNIDENYNQFSIFPNPTNSNIIIETNKIDKPLSYKIISIDGQFVNSGVIKGLKSIISLEKLDDGVYFIQINNHAERIVLHK